MGIAIPSLPGEDWGSGLARGEVDLPLPTACRRPPFLMRNDYLQSALRVIDDPNVLINVVSRRVKQLRQGNRALVESLEKLSLEDIALREIAERKISYQTASPEELRPGRR
jgi:DNA-directed RNA polymerase subunit omega